MNIFLFSIVTGPVSFRIHFVYWRPELNYSTIREYSIGMSFVKTGLK